MKNTFLVSTEEEMIDLGKKIGKELVKDQRNVSIAGDMGSGKTTLIKGIVASLGVKDIVTSPSYNIVKQYSAGQLSIFHVDCYRLNSFQEFLDLDLPLMEKDNVVLIEWGDLIANQDWKESIKIQINEDKKHIREVVVRA